MHLMLSLMNIYFSNYFIIIIIIIIMCALGFICLGGGVFIFVN